MVFIPVLAFLKIRGRELPVLCLVVNPLKEALLLRLQRNIQENFDDPVAVFIKITFVIENLAIAFLKEIRILRHALCHFISLIKFMHLDDQNILIIRAVEHGNLSARRNALIDPP